MPFRFAVFSVEDRKVVALLATDHVQRKVPLAFQADEHWTPESSP
jgi:hypothetical protein